LSEDILKASHQGLEIRIDDILLTAFAMALQTVFGIEHPCLLLVTHGRQEIAGDVDVSRTMGWFATGYPIKLPAAEGDAAKTLQHTMETLRKIPNEGIGYNALYMDEKTIEGQPKIFFNYQGEFDSGIATGGDDDFSLREYDMEVIGRVSQGRLEFFVFSRLSRDDAALFIKRFAGALSVTERNASEIIRCRLGEESCAS
jgi:hypothetical protein